MGIDLKFDDELAKRLPLRLAKLYIHACHIAKTPIDRHQSSYFSWEAALRQLASKAVVSEDGSQPVPDQARRSDRLHVLDGLEKDALE